MKRFVAGTDRGQSTLFPECLEDWIGEDNPVRVIDVFVEPIRSASRQKKRQLGKMTERAYLTEIASRQCCRTAFSHNQDPLRKGSLHRSSRDDVGLCGAILFLPTMSARTLAVLIRYQCLLISTSVTSMLLSYAAPSIRTIIEALAPH